MGDEVANATVSIGNYKGVMLCSRPFAGTVAAAHPAQGQKDSAMMPFKAGLGGEKVHPRGWDPSRKERQQAMPVRPTKDTALSKHKQWLRQLQQQRDAMKEAAMTEMQLAEERRKKFAEKQEKMRASIRNQMDDSAAPSARADEVYAEPPAEFETPALTPKEPVATATHLSREQQDKLKLSKKPAWAFATKEQQDDADVDHDLNDEEADELLKFAQGLDFDTFVDDLEVRAALEQARKRISYLTDRFRSDRESGKPETEGRPAAKSPRVMGKLTERSLMRHNASEGDAGSVAGGGGDAYSVATSVMSAAESVRHVHSKRSLSKVVERERKLAESRRNLPPVAEADLVANPKIVVSHEDDGRRLGKADDPSNLPYLNRNPAL